VDGGVRGGAGIWDYAVSAATEHSDGIVLIPNTGDPNYNAAPAGYQKHNWSARLGAQLDAADRVEFVSLSSHLDSEFNDYSPTVLAHAIEDATAEKLDWSRQWSTALSTQLGFGESRERYIDATDQYLSETRIRSYSLDGAYRLGPQRQLLFVAERTEDYLTDSSLLTSGTGSSVRSENGVGLGYLAKSGSLDVQANVRRDQDSEFGSANTGSLGLGYALTPELKVVGSAGTAFRAPTIYQNSSVYGPLSEPGGASLLAETSRNAEIGLRYAHGGVDATVTAYRNLVDNLINFGPPGNCVSSYGCYANVQHARLQGVSMAGGVRWGVSQLSATLDLQAPKDLSTGDLLPRRARTFGTVHARVPWQGWDLGSSLEFAGRRYEDAANTEPLGGYALVNLDAGVRLTRELRLQLNVDNAFNRVYQTALGYAQLPRTLTVGLRYAGSP
jgi:vitamin B12 transporter